MTIIDVKSKSFDDRQNQWALLVKTKFFKYKFDIEIQVAMLPMAFKKGHRFDMYL